MAATIRGSDRDHIRKTRDMSNSTTYTRLPHWLLARGVSGNALRLYAALGKYADRNTGKAWPSRATLMADLNASKNAVKKWTDELVDLGALHVDERRRDNGPNMSNVYTLIFDEPARRATAAPEAPVTAPQDVPAVDAGPASRDALSDTRGGATAVTPRGHERGPGTRTNLTISVTSSDNFHAQTSLSRESSPTSDLNDDARRRLRSTLMTVGDALAQGHAFHDAAPQAAWGDFLDALEDEAQDLDYMDTLLDLAETQWTVTAAIQDAYVAGTELTKMLNTARRRDQLSIA